MSSVHTKHTTKQAAAKAARPVNSGGAVPEAAPGKCPMHHYRACGRCPFCGEELTRG